MSVKNVETSNTTTRTGASGAAANSRSTSHPSRFRVMTIVCPKHGLAMREAGDQCVMCNRERARELKEREDHTSERELECLACGFKGWVRPSGMVGFLCPECGAKIESIEVNPRYYYR